MLLSMRTMAKFGSRRARMGNEDVRCQRRTHNVQDIAYSNDSLFYHSLSFESKECLAGTTSISVLFRWTSDGSFRPSRCDSIIIFKYKFKFLCLLKYIFIPRKASEDGCNRQHQATGRLDCCVHGYPGIRWRFRYCQSHVLRTKIYDRHSRGFNQ